MELTEVVGAGVVSTITKAIGEAGLKWAAQSLRDWREENAPKYWQDFNSMINPLGLKQPREVPPKIWYPIIDHGTLEDDDYLRTKYAALLANALDPGFKHGIRPSFVEILKQLTPSEAKLLDDLYGNVQLTQQTGFVENVRASKLKQAVLQLGLDPSEQILILRGLSRHGLLELTAHPQSFANLMAYNEEPVAQLNRFGYEFVAACRPPLA